MLRFNVNFWTDRWMDRQRQTDRPRTLDVGGIKNVNEKLEFAFRRVEKLQGKKKMLAASILYFSHDVFKRLLSKGCKKCKDFANCCEKRNCYLRQGLAHFSTILHSILIDHLLSFTLFVFYLKCSVGEEKHACYQ